MKKLPKRKDLIYPELSYTIIGILFEVYNNLGPAIKKNTIRKPSPQLLKNPVWL